MTKILLATFILIIVQLACQAPRPSETWYQKSIKENKLYDKYSIDSLFKPSSFEADFNGDGKKDIVFQISDKVTKKRGILILHDGGTKFYIFGAGKKFGNGGDDFKWLDAWSLYTDKNASETVFDEETGDILGSKEITLSNPGLMIFELSDGSPLAGGIIHWSNNKYHWIHQGE
jgi:hypothetical protein